MPASWGETRVVVLPVDPCSVHVYWELAPGERVKAAQRLGRANSKVKPVLRFHETTGALAPFDVDVDLKAGKHYVQLESPAKSYRVELALKGARFVSLARSSVVYTPAAGPSARGEQRWMRQSIAPPAAREQWSPENEAPGARLLASISLETGEERLIERAISEPQTPPIDFAEALQKKLAELYAAAQWRSPLARTVPRGSQDFSAQPRRRGKNPAGMDLTDRNEASMAWGCSSGPAVRRAGES